MKGEKATRDWSWSETEAPVERLEEEWANRMSREFGGSGGILLEKGPRYVGSAEGKEGHTVGTRRRKCVRGKKKKKHTLFCCEGIVRRQAWTKVEGRDVGISGWFCERKRERKFSPHLFSTLPLSPQFFSLSFVPILPCSVSLFFLLSLSACNYTRVS